MRPESAHVLALTGSAAGDRSSRTSHQARTSGPLALYSPSFGEFLDHAEPHAPQPVGVAREDLRLESRSGVDDVDADPVIEPHELHGQRPVRTHAGVKHAVGDQLTDDQCDIRRRRRRDLPRELRQHRSAGLARRVHTATDPDRDRFARIRRPGHRRRQATALRSERETDSVGGCPRDAAASPGRDVARPADAGTSGSLRGSKRVSAVRLIPRGSRGRPRPSAVRVRSGACAAF